MTYDPAALDPIGNIDSEQTFSSGKDVFLKENEDYCPFRKVTGWTGPEDDCQQKKVIESIFIDNTPSKRIDPQCETGPSVAPY